MRIQITVNVPDTDIEQILVKMCAIVVSELAKNESLKLPKINSSNHIARNPLNSEILCNIETTINNEKT